MSAPSPPLEAFIKRVGQRSRPFTDLYAFLLRTSWTRLVLLAAALYVLTNAIFATLFWIVPGSIASSDGSWEEAFYFSVQTLGTIGYGYMHAQGRWGNLVVTAEAFVSIFVTATLTGIVFSKFARPHSRVLFSKPILIETRNGKPTLTFRVANERGNDVVEAAVRVCALMGTKSEEGKSLRRFFDLELERASSPVFLLSWQVLHVIDESSPLHGLTATDLMAGDVRFVVSLTGFDGTFMQTIHARHVYWPSDVLFGHRFVDVIENLPGGVAQMDYRKFHETVAERKH
ncbi:MAG: hypothetical protein IT378_11900 [Sandaracinaceae bacterium]|nr:hypothetical protein [Sandaracinaceae bacterium]